jgi:hypothetical protein
MGQAFVADALIHVVVEILSCRLGKFVRWLVSVSRRFLRFVLVGGRDGEWQNKAEKQSKSNSEKAVESHGSVSLGKGSKAE